LIEVDGEGIVAWFNSDEGRAAVRRLAKGVGTVSISRSSLVELRLPVRFQKGNNLPLSSTSDGGASFTV